MFVERTGQAAEKSHRNKHRRQHEGDRHHRATDISQRRLGRRRRRKIFRVELVLHRLHHDDRIIDDDTDRQHQSEQRQRVDRKAQRGKHGEGADQGHRHHQHRNQGRTPRLQEQKHHQQHQQHGFKQGDDHFLHRLGDKGRGAVRHRIHHARREALRQRLHGRLNITRGIECIGIGLQENTDEHARHAVLLHGDRVISTAEFNARNILQTHDLAVGRGADDDVFVLRDIGQSTLHGDRILHRHAGWCGRHADATGRRHHVLLLHHALHIGGTHTETRHLLGVQPDAHAVIACAKQTHEAHALDAGECILKVEQRIVAQKCGVEATVRRGQRNHLQEVGRLFTDGDAIANHVCRQLALRDSDAVLHVHRAEILIAADFEGHGQRIGAVIGTLRIHVNHVLRAVDLLLDRRGNRLRDDGGIGPRQGRHHLHLRRHDLRILGDRQIERGNRTGQRNDQRDDR